MKILIIAPETGIQVTKHVVVHAGQVVDIPFHQAEHLIRLKQAVIAPLQPLPLPDLPEPDRYRPGAPDDGRGMKR